MFWLMYTNDQIMVTSIIVILKFYYFFMVNTLIHFFLLSFLIYTLLLMYSPDCHKISENFKCLYLTQNPLINYISANHYF